jgi:serine/threonine protein kinase
MGFVVGQSLSQRLAEGPLPVREASELIRRVSEAIEYAHRRGVIHRDLKPANIQLDHAGNPRVADFGLAKKVHGDSGLTGSGQIMGTPSYMPPEQAGGTRVEVSPAADVYALGSTLYALVTGRPPFQAATPMDTVIQVISDEPVPPRRLNASIPRDLDPPETPIGDLVAGSILALALGTMLPGRQERDRLGSIRGRRYIGLKRHLILSAVSYLFLARVRQRWAEKKSGADGLPAPHGAVGECFLNSCPVGLADTTFFRRRAATKSV